MHIHTPLYAQQSYWPNFVECVTLKPNESLLGDLNLTPAKIPSALQDAELLNTE